MARYKLRAKTTRRQNLDGYIPRASREIFSAGAFSFAETENKQQRAIMRKRLIICTLSERQGLVTGACVFIVFAAEWQTPRFRVHKRLAWTQKNISFFPSPLFHSFIFVGNIHICRVFIFPTRHINAKGNAKSAVRQWSAIYKYDKQFFLYKQNINLNEYNIQESKCFYSYNIWINTNYKIQAPAMGPNQKIYTTIHHKNDQYTLPWKKYNTPNPCREY